MKGEILNSASVENWQNEQTWWLGQFCLYHTMLQNSHDKFLIPNFICPVYYFIIMFPLETEFTPLSFVQKSAIS